MTMVNVLLTLTSSIDGFEGEGDFDQFLAAGHTNLLVASLCIVTRFSRLNNIEGHTGQFLTQVSDHEVNTPLDEVI